MAQWNYVASFVRCQIIERKIVRHHKTVRFKSWADYCEYWQEFKRLIFKDYQVKNYYQLMCRFPSFLTGDVVEAAWYRPPRTPSETSTNGWNYLEQFCSHYDPKLARRNNVIEWNKRFSIRTKYGYISSFDRHAPQGNRRLQKTHSPTTHGFPRWREEIRTS